MKKRMFVKKAVAGVITAAMLTAGLIGCGGSGEASTANTQAEDEQQGKKEVVENDGTLKEAPKLAEKVEAGELPKVDERMPSKDDIMVESTEEIGHYSSELVSAHTGRDDKWGYGSITEEALFRFNMDGELEPNVAKGYDVNEDSTEYTIYLREGMKWSDGEDFTADDVIFYYEHMCLKETFGKSLYPCYKSVNPETGEETPCTMEKVDDYTVKVKFVDSSPLFLQKLAIDNKWAFAPEHYYKELLPEFIGDEAAAKKAEELGYADVGAMGSETGYYYWNIVGRPTLRAWVATNDPDSETFIMERNPYYWKTDEAGQQLPYVDELHFIRTSDVSQQVLLAMDGTLDFAGVDFSNIVTLKENQTEDNYNVNEWTSTGWTDMGLVLNQACKDEKYRELFQDIRFRQALSIAVDREKYVELVMDGLVDPQQAAPAEGLFGADEEWRNKWTEYDVEGAKKFLEEIGLVEGSDGFYDFADGTDLVLNIMTREENVDKIGEILTKYFEEAGLKTTYKKVDQTLGNEMIAGNEHTVWLQPCDVINPSVRPDNLVPIKTNIAWYGAYGTWYNNGRSGDIEPTKEIIEVLDAYDAMRAATNMDEVNKYAQEILDLHKENTWIIGYGSPKPFISVTAKNLKNFPEEGVYCDEYRLWGIAHFATLWIDE